MTELLEKFWNPEADDMIEGIIIDKKHNVGPYENMLYKIQDENIIYCIWGKTRLDELMRDTCIGDKVKLTYLGTVSVGKDYHRKEYKLKVLLDDEE